ncbi:hypothetical protein VNO78_25670 [Psophocarpus tetragonolobus]|uniref:Uncharacterized protein n=1 Tax=Psophocarpus tetragonolobus TaxID=3891 RepID=A0AAN9S7T5_PSOTE
MVVSMLLYFVAIMVIQNEGCLEKERSALLQIKQYILSIGHTIPMPLRLPRMVKLETLDLSYNAINGLFSNLAIEQLQRLKVLDLSNNHLTGSIKGEINDSSIVKLSSVRALLMVKNRLEDFQEEVKATIEFRTKNNLYTYSGNILEEMAGVELSCNMLTGNIPFQIGNLQQIRALNLSHNNLFGSIPNTFCNLSQIESLDLSYNNLSGEIPSQLTKLNFLTIFNVSYNNLSGMPPITGQFANFGEDNYRGNRYLFEALLKQKCEVSNSSQYNNANGKETMVDIITFYWSFIASYTTILLGFMMVLCINAYWRKTWFYFIAKIINKCFPNLPLY